MTAGGIRLCALCAFAAAAAGCTGVKTLQGNGGDMVVVENSAYMILQCIPLVAGDPDRPNEMGFRMFSNTLKVATNMKILGEQTAAEGAEDVADVATFTTDESIIPVLLSRKTMQTSARLVRGDRRPQ